MASGKFDEMSSAALPDEKLREWTGWLESQRARREATTIPFARQSVAREAGERGEEVSGAGLLIPRKEALPEYAFDVWWRYRAGQHINSIASSLKISRYHVHWAIDRYQRLARLYGHSQRSQGVSS